MPVLGYGCLKARRLCLSNPSTCDPKRKNAGRHAKVMGVSETQLELRKLADEYIARAVEIERKNNMGESRERQMIRKGVEFTLTEIEPGRWKWNFQIGETVKSGRTATLPLAARRANHFTPGRFRFVACLVSSAKIFLFFRNANQAI
jgi:hypothetical protein